MGVRQEDNLISRRWCADNNTTMSDSLTHTTKAVIRAFGWGWSLAIWAAFSLLATAICILQGFDVVPLVVVLAATGAIVSIGAWKPRLIGTGLALVGTSSFVGLIAAFYALNATKYVSLAEVNIRMIAFMFLLAVLAHRLPGRPWVRLLWAAAFIAGPGIPAVQLVPQAGVYMAYLAGLAGVFVTSIPFRRLLRRGPKNPNTPVSHDPDQTGQVGSGNHKTKAY